MGNLNSTQKSDEAQRSDAEIKKQMEMKIAEERQSEIKEKVLPAMAAIMPADGRGPLSAAQEAMRRRFGM